MTQMSADWEKSCKKAMIVATEEFIKAQKERVKEPKGLGLLDPTRDAIAEALAPLLKEIGDLKSRVSELEKK